MRHTDRKTLVYATTSIAEILDRAHGKVSRDERELLAGLRRQLDDLEGDDAELSQLEACSRRHMLPLVALRYAAILLNDFSADDSPTMPAEMVCMLADLFADPFGELRKYAVHDDRLQRVLDEREPMG